MPLASPPLPGQARRSRLKPPAVKEEQLSSKASPPAEAPKEEPVSPRVARAASTLPSPKKRAQWTSPDLQDLQEAEQRRKAQNGDRA